MTIDTYYGQPIESLSEHQLIKALYVVSENDNPYNHLMANALLQELKWHMTEVKFEEFKKELFNDFSGFYNQCIKSVMTNISQEIINYK